MQSSTSGWGLLVLSRVGHGGLGSGAWSLMTSRGVPTACGWRSLLKGGCGLTGWVVYTVFPLFGDVLGATSCLVKAWCCEVQHDLALGCGEALVLWGGFLVDCAGLV